LTNIRDRIMKGEQAGQACNVLLVCCGVSVERRRLLANERDELRGDYLRTAVLIFVTICLIEHQRRGELEDDEADNHIETLQRASSASLWRRVKPEANKKIAATASTSVAAPEVAALDPTAAGSEGGLRPWREVIEEAEAAKQAPPSDGDVAYSAMCSGVMLLGSSNIETFEALSEIFYRHTALQLASSALRKAADADFLSLSAAAFCGTVNTDGVSPAKCKALIAAGESEAGQQVMRDMVLSFLLPSSVVGVRRTLLLPRAVATKATMEYTDIVQFAHETAMEGLEWTWEHSEDPLKLTCALLTAVACLTTREGEDPIRKGDAFGGLVSLPFLNTATPAESKFRVSMIPESKRWVLFKMQNGEPIVQAAVEGLEGVKLTLVGLSEAL
jgi:hypothetical protein